MAQTHRERNGRRRQPKGPPLASEPPKPLVKRERVPQLRFSSNEQDRGASPDQKSFPASPRQHQGAHGAGCCPFGRRRRGTRRRSHSRAGVAAYGTAQERETLLKIG